jgi:hypothetical protein
MKKTTMYLDDEKVEALRKELGLASDAEAVRVAVEMALRSLSYKRIRQFMGSEKGRPLADVPRRREPAVAKARSRAKRSA